MTAQSDIFATDFPPNRCPVSENCCFFSEGFPLHEAKKGGLFSPKWHPDWSVGPKIAAKRW